MDDTMRLIALHAVGQHWYATVSYGNVQHRAPTPFLTSMSHDEVIAAIKRRSPDLVIAETVR